ncbi:MAG: hypothetical protein AAF597_13980, partial [Bacteroidota bacterium]
MTRRKIYATVFEFYLNPEVYSRRRHVAAEVFGANGWERLLRLSKSLVGNLYKWFTVRSRFSPELVGQKWLVAGTRNQERSTDFLLEDNFLLVPANFYQPAKDGVFIRWYTLPKVTYLLWYLPFFFRALLRDPLHFYRVFAELAHGVGVYENQLKVLRR